jgi:initiation factor 1A
MVKNTHGGNKHKSQARKFTNVKASNKLRIAEEDGEIYAVVTNMLGNGMFYAHGIDDCKRLGHIRGKFSGRGKRDNNVEIGKWVLLGEREWDINKDTNTNKKNQIVKKCDLLEVYNELDKERLKESVSEKWSILISQDTKASTELSKKDELFDFTNEKDEECQRILEELTNNKTKAIELKNNSDNLDNSDNPNPNDWIDIDDI